MVQKEKAEVLPSASFALTYTQPQCVGKCYGRTAPKNCGSDMVLANDPLEPCSIQEPNGLRRFFVSNAYKKINSRNAERLEYDKCHNAYDDHVNCA